MNRLVQRAWMGGATEADTATCIATKSMVNGVERRVEPNK